MNIIICIPIVLLAPWNQQVWSGGLYIANGKSKTLFNSSKILLKSLCELADNSAYSNVDIPRIFLPQRKDKFKLSRILGPSLFWSSPLRLWNLSIRDSVPDLLQNQLRSRQHAKPNHSELATGMDATRLEAQHVFPSSNIVAPCSPLLH
jgi:hypothetical protein